MTRPQVGKEHYEVATAVQKILQDYKSLQDIIAILGMDELSEEDKLTVSSALQVSRGYLLNAFPPPRSSVRVRSSVSCRSPSLSRRSSLVSRAVSSP